jgi:ribonuclease HI
MARIITGTPRATNTDSLLLEANLDPIDRYIDDRTMAAVERIRRRHQSDPLYNKAMGPTPSVRKSKKFKAQCWQQRSDAILARFKIRFDRRRRNHITGQLLKKPCISRSRTIPHPQSTLSFNTLSPQIEYRYAIAPHQAKSIKLRLYPNLLEPINPETPDADKKRIAEATIDHLRQRGATWELWLDASVANGKGVGVAHFYTGPPTANVFNPVTRQWASPDTRKWETFALAGAGVHSFTAEAIALKAGLHKLTKQLLPAPFNKSLIIATDCRSLVLALEKGPIKLKDPTISHIWRSLYKLFDRGIVRIAIQWVPSHCGIQRNEFADARAKTLLLNAKPTEMRRVPMLYSTAVSYYKARNRQHYHDLLTAEETDRLMITNSKANLRAEDKLTRTQQSTLAQLRSGTCTSMGWYVGYCRSGYDPDHKNDLCRWCGVAPESVLHVFNDCEDLQISLLRAEYHTTTNKTFSANTLCSDQLAALEFHAAAVRVLGVRGGGL